MAVTDLWVKADKTPTKRNGRGLRYRVTVPGHPAKAFRTKTEAQAHELKLKTTPPPRARADVTVGPLVDAWLAGKAHLSKGGLSACRSGAGHAKARWADTLVGDVHTDDVQSWVSALSYTRSGVVRAASRDLRSKSLAALAGALDIAVRRGHLEANPCRGVTVGKAVRRDARFLTIAELEQLAGRAGRYRVMVWFLGTTGVRVGECCALDVGDVDRRRRRARIRKSKNGRPRDVSIPASVFAMLDLDRPATAPLFVLPRGGRVTVRNWGKRVFGPAATAAGHAGLHPHDLRHTAASLMIRSGATVKDVQNQLGHKSAAMTLDLYAGWWDDTLDDVASRMDGLLSTRSVP